jgi:Ca2+-transporting ATPase
VVGFLLGTNIGEVITVFMAMLLWHKTPLLSMQLLWINLVTDSLPAIALGMEAVESDVMDKKPKPKNEGIFAHGLGFRVVIQGIMFAALTLVGFKVGENVTGTLEGGQTLAFMVLSLTQIVQAFNMRSEHSLFKIGPFKNKTLNLAALSSTLLVALVMFTPLKSAFGLVTLPLELYLLGVGLIFVPLVVMEISKLFGLIKRK